MSTDIVTNVVLVSDTIGRFQVRPQLSLQSSLASVIETFNLALNSATAELNNSRNDVCEIRLQKKKDLVRKKKPGLPKSHIDGLIEL